MRSAAVRPISQAHEQLLPVLDPLVGLFPGAGLRRGSTVVVTPGPAPGTTSLAMSLTVAASRAGSWCAAIGLPELGLAAATGLGVSLERFALIRDPGQQWAVVTAALVEAVDIVLVRPSRHVRASDARRLVARARERGSVLVPLTVNWPESADLRLRVVAAAWEGLGFGHGHLEARTVEVVATGRGAASRERHAYLWLPGHDGSVTMVEPRVVSTGAPNVMEAAEAV